jgi:hypothetical protein
MRIGGFPFCIDGLTSEMADLFSPRAIVCMLQRNNRTDENFVRTPQAPQLVSYSAESGASSGSFNMDQHVHPGESGPPIIGLLLSVNLVNK